MKNKIIYSTLYIILSASFFFFGWYARGIETNKIATEKLEDTGVKDYDVKFADSQAEYTDLNKIAPYKFKDFLAPLSDKLPPASEIESDYGDERIGFDDKIFNNFFAGQYTFYQTQNGTMVFNSFDNYFDKHKHFTLAYDSSTYIFFKPDSRLIVVREEPRNSSAFTSSEYSKYEYVYTYLMLDKEGSLNYLGSYVFVENSFKKIEDKEAEKSASDRYPFS